MLPVLDVDSRVRHRMDRFAELSKCSCEAGTPKTSSLDRDLVSAAEELKVHFRVHIVIKKRGFAGLVE